MKQGNAEAQPTVEEETTTAEETSQDVAGSEELNGSELPDDVIELPDHVNDDEEEIEDAEVIVDKETGKTVYPCSWLVLVGFISSGPWLGWVMPVSHC